MAIPTQHDRDLGMIDAWHGIVMVRLRTLHHAGERRDPRGVLDALDKYTAAVIALTQDGE